MLFVIQLPRWWASLVDRATKELKEADQIKVNDFLYPHLCHVATLHNIVPCPLSSMDSCMLSGFLVPNQSFHWWFKSFRFIWNDIFCWASADTGNLLSDCGLLKQSVKLEKILYPWNNCPIDLRLFLYFFGIIVVL